MATFIDVSSSGRAELINVSLIIRVSREGLTDFDHTATIYPKEAGRTVAHQTEEHYGAAKDKLQTVGVVG